MSLAKDLNEANVTIEAHEATIAGHVATAETLTAKVGALETAAEAFEADKDTAKAEGATAAIAGVKARAETYGADFAIEHIDESDADIQKAYIGKLEAENKANKAKLVKAGLGLEATGTGGDEGGGPAKSANEIRKELIAGGMSAAKAGPESQKMFAEQNKGSK